MRIEYFDHLILITADNIDIFINIKDYYYQNFNISDQSWYQYIITTELSTYLINIKVILMVSVKGMRQDSF
jgi:hypothetical protein